MRRWDYSVTEISVTGREIFHMTMPTELQSTSSSRKKMQAEDCYCLFFGLALKKCFFQIFNGAGGGEELQMLIQVAVLFRLKCEHIHKVP